MKELLSTDPELSKSLKLALARSGDIVKKIVLICFTSLLTLSLQGQSNIAYIDAYFKELKRGNSGMLTQNQFEQGVQEPTIIDALEGYLFNDKVPIKENAIRLIALFGSVHTNLDTRQKAIDVLLSIALKEPSSIAKKIYKGLIKFEVADYDDAAKAQLLSVINNRIDGKGEFVKIAGFLHLEKDLKELLSTDPELSKSLKLALARSGDQDILDKVMKKVISFEVNDELVEGLVPTLVYIRQKETFDYMFEVILNDEKNCTPIGPDVSGNILCAYRVIEQIAPYIEDFPVEVGASRDLLVDDYKVALQEVRGWITIHKDDYIIIDNKY